MSAESHATHAVPGPIALLTYLNAILFAVGSLLHLGVTIGPLDEPDVIPAMMVEVLCTLIIGLGTMGIFSRAVWARRMARFSHAFALVGVGVVTLILAFDAHDSSFAFTILQITRGAISTVSLVLLARTPRDLVRS